MDVVVVNADVQHGRIAIIVLLHEHAGKPDPRNLNELEGKVGGAANSQARI